MKLSKSQGLLMDARAEESKSKTVPSPLLKLSNPPTQVELQGYQDVPVSELPEPYYRSPQDRVYVNRDLRMDKVSKAKRKRKKKKEERKKSKNHVHLPVPLL